MERLQLACYDTCTHTHDHYHIDHDDAGDYYDDYDDDIDNEEDGCERMQLDYNHHVLLILENQLCPPLKPVNKQTRQTNPLHCNALHDTNGQMMTN